MTLSDCGWSAIGARYLLYARPVAPPRNRIRGVQIGRSELIRQVGALIRRVTIQALSELGLSAVSLGSKGRSGLGGGRRGGLGRAAGEQHTGASGRAGQGTAYPVDVVHEGLGHLAASRIMWQAWLVVIFFFVGVAAGHGSVRCAAARAIRVGGPAARRCPRERLIRRG